jgi:SAM-dependent methyltransferase
MTSGAITRGEQQVAIEHYAFETYATHARWSSFWHQIRDVLAAKPVSCLVIGAGDGIVPAVLRHLGVSVTTLDVDSALEPDLLGDVRALPIDDRAFDVVIASQILEHIPFDDVPRALGELRRVARKRVVISIPQRGRAWEIVVRLPILPKVARGGVLPARTRHSFDGTHHWEVGARGLRRSRFEAVLTDHFTVFSTYVVTDNPYHRFYVADL